MQYDIKIVHVLAYVVLPLMHIYMLALIYMQWWLIISHILSLLLWCHLLTWLIRPQVPILAFSYFCFMNKLQFFVLDSEVICIFELVIAGQNVWSMLFFDNAYMMAYFFMNCFIYQAFFYNQVKVQLINLVMLKLGVHVCVSEVMYIWLVNLP